jgi:glycerol-3-phosphate dehydrogenase (NAD(P)+)
MQGIAVIGGGSWGTALATIAGRAGHDVMIWSRNGEVVDSINRDHTNSKYLTDTKLPQNIRATVRLSEALKDAELVILAAPSHATRDTLAELKSVVHEQMIFVSATKGIEIETGKRMSQVARDVLGEDLARRFVCLSGPSFAKEVVEGHPTAIVAAGPGVDDTRAVQARLSFENLRIYTNDDLIGTELGGAVKNVMAIAAGMVAGLGFGSNSIAALITRGLAEMTRLALREGGKLETLMGLAGLGDLVLTCTGALSRNRYVGQELAKGRSVDEISASMKEVAEGIKTTLAVRRLADRLEVEMPITREVYQVLYEQKTPKDAAAELMMRPLRGEFYS